MIAVVVGLFSAFRMSRSLTSPLLPIDLTQFYLSGQIARLDRWNVLYDIEQWRGEVSRSFRFVEEGSLEELVRPFAYPPILPQVFALVAGISLTALAPIYRILGLLVTYLGLRKISGSVGAGLALLFTGATASAFHLGQNTFLSAAVLSLGTLSIVKERPRYAGFFFGMLIFKPQLLISLLVCLLVAGPRHRNLAYLSVIWSTVFVAVSVVISPTAWLAYPRAAFDLAVSSNSDIDNARMGAFSLANKPGIEQAGVVLGVVVSILALVGLRMLVRRLPVNTGLAYLMIVSLLISPWILRYDWVLLSIPAALWWREQAPPRALAYWLPLGMMLTVQEALSTINLSVNVWMGPIVSLVAVTTVVWSTRTRMVPLPDITRRGPKNRSRWPVV